MWLGQRLVIVTAGVGVPEIRQQVQTGKEIFKGRTTTPTAARDANGKEQVQAFTKGVSSPTAQAIHRPLWSRESQLSTK